MCMYSCKVQEGFVVKKEAVDSLGVLNQQGQIMRQLLYKISAAKGIFHHEVEIFVDFIVVKCTGDDKQV